MNHHFIGQGLSIIYSARFGYVIEVVLIHLLNFIENVSFNALSLDFVNI